MVDNENSFKDMEGRLRLEEEEVRQELSDEKRFRKEKQTEAIEKVVKPLHDLFTLVREIGDDYLPRKAGSLSGIMWSEYKVNLGDCQIRMVHTGHYGIDNNRIYITREKTESDRNIRTYDGKIRILYADYQCHRESASFHEANLNLRNKITPDCIEEYKPHLGWAQEAFDGFLKEVTPELEQKAKEVRLMRKEIELNELKGKIEREKISNKSRF